MLCACSREQKFHFEEAPQSPESLATRDFSVSGLSSRTGDCETKFDDNHIDDIESTLRETLTLNYEEARALLGRLEYQRGNFDAALQVFQGIDIRCLKPRMVKAIAERSRPRKAHSKRKNLLVNVMSMHSVSLLLEAILLKSKSLQGLGHFKDAAMECKTILDIVESAYPHGMPQSIVDDCKLKEIFHRALELLPEFWKQAGYLDETVSAYRRALVKPWNLDSHKCGYFQKELAAILLYGGDELTLPAQLQQVWGSIAPKTNIEEAILLFLILMKKMLFQEISWDTEIVNHLTFALSLSGQFELLAHYVEELLPGIYNRTERWYLLALCYSAAGMDDVALNILRNSLGYSERKHKSHLTSLLLASNLCCKNTMLASEGINFAERAIKCTNGQGKHFMGLSSHLLGVCYGNYARSFTSELERLKVQKKALDALENAAALEKDDPEVIYSLGIELAVQRKLDEAKDVAVKYVELMGGSSVNCWRLLALVVSAEQVERAESVVDLAIAHTGIEDQLELLQMKAVLQVAQEQTRDAIETYRSLLALIRAQKENQTGRTDSMVKPHPNLEVEAWTDLASIYTKLGLQMDSNSCLEIAKSIGYFSQKTWHTKGMILEAQTLHKEALAAFSVSLSFEPDYVPSMVSTGVVLRKIGGKSLPVARSFLTNALKIEPTNHDAWLNLGLVYKLEGSLHEAADCFRKACELKESSPIIKNMDCTKYCHPTDKLTDDLLIEILCRLPVKSLLLCRCVSKAWQALISNAQYRDKLPRTMSGLFYHACGTASDWGYHVEYVDMQSYNESSSVDANLSFLLCGKYARIVDCCNGLLLCHSSKGRTAKYYVCNPVTKRWATLPNTDYRVHPLALVFDPNSGDELETLVSFSSETGKWVEKLVLWGSEMDTYFRRHVFFNGTIHLLAYRNPIVVVVDFEREIYRRIDLPATKVDGRSCLGQSQGYLHYSETSGNQMIVWVLKNYDRNEWVVKHSISLEALFEKHQVQPVPSPSHQSSSDVFDILPFHPDLDVVFLKIHGKIFSYHLISAKLAEIMNPCRRTGSFYVYTPCLLLEDLGL